jgi:hypothetical protein
MKTLQWLLVFGFLSLFACKNTKNITASSSKQPFEYGLNTLLKFKVNYSGSEYWLKVKLRSYGDSCNFLFSMTNDSRTEGSVSIGKKALESANAHDNYFYSGHKELQQKTTVWMSRNSYRQLKQNGKTVIVPSYRDSVTIQVQTTEKISVNIDDKPVMLSVIKAKGTSKSGEKEYWILDDPNFPLIMYMNLGWTVQVESIVHMEELNMKLKPSLFTFKPGVKLFYSLEEYGCGRDVVLELKEMTDTAWTFTYDYYKYACLYGNEDEQFQGNLIMYSKAVKEPNDFELLYPSNFKDVKMIGGNPILLDAKIFASLFKQGNAVFNISHFVYEPMEEDYEYMDSAEIAESNEALKNSGKTRFILKEADVETGYYMYPIEINGTEKVIEAVKLEAADIDDKTLYVVPSNEWPLILSFYDEDFGIEWNLVAIEYPEN